MKTIKTIKNVAGALLVTVTTTLALTACHPDDDPGTGGTDGMITVSRLEVGIESIGSTGTRAGDAGTRAEGVYAGVKTGFADGDVLHLYVNASVNGQYTHELATATYTAGTTDGTAGTWSISPALVLPENAVDMSIIAFYDGKTTEYKDDQEQFIIALAAAAAGVTIVQNNGDPTPVSDNACDALMASNADGFVGSITLGANGALTIKLAHTNALIRLGKVENRLTGKEIKAVEAVVYESGIGNLAQYRRIPLTMTNADGYTGAEAFSYVFSDDAPYVLTSFVVTINDIGSTGTEGDEELIIPVPDATGTLGSGGASGGTGDKITDSEGKPVTGQPVLSGKRYTYHLILAPGMLTATLSTADGDDLQWNDKGQLVTAPDEYIPIYGAEELKKIGVKKNDGTEGYEYSYTYTDASGTEQSIPYSLDGKYILMADIDLANAAPDGNDANWTPIGKNKDNSFTGRFNGNGHTITGMKVKTSEYYAGFFGAIDGAVIYNLHFEGASVTHTGNDQAGTLVGYAKKSSIALCSATDCTVSGKYRSGGLVGASSTSHLTRCYAINCTVTNNGDNSSIAGGLVGYNNSSSGSSNIFAACYTTGCTVTAIGNSSSSSAGGLVGNTYSDNNATLYGCYALYAAVTATSSSSSSSGTLAGYLYAGTSNSSSVISCYATNKASTASNTLIGSIVNNDKNPSSPGSTIITGCISPLKDPGSDTSAPSENIDYSGVIGNGGNGTTYGITYRDGTDGYAPLVGSITDCSDVRTVIVNTNGGDVTENGSTTIPPPAASTSSPARGKLPRSETSTPAATTRKRTRPSSAGATRERSS